MSVKIGMTTNRDRITPCFAGVELWILAETQDLGEREVMNTEGWHPLAWPKELMRHDVSVLLCSGIDQFVWGALRGYGIQVIPNATGGAEDVLRQWRSGLLAAPQVWPPDPSRGRGGCRSRRWFRGGR